MHFSLFLIFVLIGKATKISVLQQRVWQSVWPQISRICYVTPNIPTPAVLPFSMACLPGFSVFLFGGGVVCLFCCGSVNAPIWSILTTTQRGMLLQNHPSGERGTGHGLNNNTFKYYNFSFTKIVYHVDQLTCTEKREML